MADLYPVAGCKIFIGGVKATKSTDFAAADFTGVSWIEIDGWETMGSFGDSASLISADLINRGRTTKLKGTANAGQMQCNFAILRDDVGQIALRAAGKASNKNNYAVKVLFNDAPSAGASPKPSAAMFVALVMGTTEQGGSANSTQMLQATLEINSNIVMTAASAS